MYKIFESSSSCPFMKDQKQCKKSKPIEFCTSFSSSWHGPFRDRCLLTYLQSCAILFHASSRKIPANVQLMPSQSFKA